MQYQCYNFKSKYLFILFSFLIFFSNSFLFAQSGKITGKIIDKVSQEPLFGANVIIVGTSMGAASDIEGEFVIPLVPYGTHVIAIRYIGYQEQTFVVDLNSQNPKQDFVIELEAELIEGETVVITAQAQGQVSAIQQQLAADQIANIVSEQKLQELPDFNAASALSRLPGVSTTQSSGEDNKIVIRGLAPKYNAVQIEGVQMASTGSSQIGLSSNPGAGSGGVNNDRSVDLTSISPYMIRTIAVYKSLTPDMNANAIGGTVNMELREAPEKTRFDFLYQQGYTAKSKSFANYRIVGSGSARFFNNKFGLYALANAESYDRNADNMGASYALAGDASQIDSTTGYRPVKVTRVDFNRHLETRNRYGGNLILDYRLPNGSLKFTNMYSRIESDYTDHRQSINYNTGDMGWSMRKGDNSIDQQMHSLKLDYDLDFMTANISVSYAGSKNNLENSPSLSFDQDQALQAGVIRDNVPPQDLTFLLDEYRGDTNVILRSGNLFTNKYKESRLTFKADFDIPFSFGTAFNGSFKFGGQIYNQENEVDQETPYLSFSGSTDPEASDIQAKMIRGIAEKFGVQVNKQGMMTGDYFKNSDNSLLDSFLDDEYGSMFYVSDPDLLEDIINYVLNEPEFDASNKQSSSGAQGGWYNGLYQSLANDYNYKEDYYASYGMVKVNWSDFTFIGGVRYEKVKSEYFAYNARDMRNPQGQVMYDTTAFMENDFLLPMVQVKYQPLNFFDVRYAYTQTLARPSYHSLSSKFTITQNNQIYTGNPQLKPAHAYNHDLAFTFHSNTLGLFTIGGFYKSIDDFVYSAAYRLDMGEEAGIDNIDNYTIIRDGAKVVEPFKDATVHKSFNNPNESTVKGLEIDFQHNFWYAPAPFNNFVFGINYARIWSETTYPWYDVGTRLEGRKVISFLIDSSSVGRLIDQPDHVLNSYLGYDYEGFSARITARYQDNSFRGTGGKYKENDSYTTESLRWDFSARQKLPWYNIELFLDITNLTSNNTKWIQRSIEGFRGVQNYGLTANLGVRVKY